MTSGKKNTATPGTPIRTAGAPATPMTPQAQVRNAPNPATAPGTPMNPTLAGGASAPGALAAFPTMPPPTPHTRSIMDKVADALLGVSPEETNPYNKYALICAKCFSHNGLCPKDEFDFVRESRTFRRDVLVLRLLSMVNRIPLPSMRLFQPAPERSARCRSAKWTARDPAPRDQSSPPRPLRVCPVAARCRGFVREGLARRQLADGGRRVDRDGRGAAATTTISFS